MINSNWNRWIFASISKFFHDKKGSLNLRIEGQTIYQSEDFIELRVAGPTYRKFTRNKYDADIIINILVNTIKDNDAHKIYRFTGLVEAMFEPCIPVFKYGNTPADDDSSLGILHQLRNGENIIETIPYGLVSTETNIIQTAVESYYRIKLSG